MVDFGLKLKDNKVAEWTDKYIDYDMLNALLIRAESSVKIFDSLERRDPILAVDVKAQFLASHTSHQPKHSTENLLHSIRRSLSYAALLEKSDFDGHERDALLAPKRTLTPTHQTTTPKTPPIQNTSPFIGKLLSRNLSGCFELSMEDKLNEILRIQYDIVDEFSNVIFSEMKKVNDFYNAKVEEISHTLSMLEDHVRSSHHLNATLIQTHDRNRLRKSPSNKSQSLMLNPDAEIGQVGEQLEASSSENDGRKSQNDISREIESVKRAIIDLHRRSKLLENFAIMNTTAFVHIIKKFESILMEHQGRFSFVGNDDNICGGGVQASSLCEKMERIYADWFCDGNYTDARAHMLPKKGDVLQMDWSQLRLGYRMGMCSVLAIWVCWDCILNLYWERHSAIGGRLAFPVFRGCGGLLLLHWYWGISVYVWTRFRINYIYLFDFDPRIVDTPLTIFEDATDETLVFFIILLLYYKTEVHDLPIIVAPGIYPFILVLYTIKCLIFPWRTRGPLWKVIFSVITAPLSTPTFYHSYVGDIFTSMIKVFQDLLWTLCFVFSGDFLVHETMNGTPIGLHQWQSSLLYKNVLIPLICLAPLWIRFNQCLRRYMDTRERWPHLANAFKYALSQSVTLFGAFHPLYLMLGHHGRASGGEVSDSFEGNIARDLFQSFWMSVFVLSSLYSWTWDVYMDWGLGQPEFGFLGAKLMFPEKGHYYGAIGVDLFLRFMWVLTLIPPSSGARFEIPQYLTAISMDLELTRRTMWGFLRLEYEHRHKKEGSRRADFVPLHFSTGHEHINKKHQDHVGWQVLAEVVFVTTVVIAISVGSVVSAQKASSSDSLGVVASVHNLTL